MLFLMQRYTSRQAYSVIGGISAAILILNTLSQGGVEPVKALNLMLQYGKISSDCVLLVDEMYLQKGLQYHGGSLVGADENGELYTGVVTFVIVGINNEKIPFVVKACPEVRISGSWLSAEIEETLETMNSTGFNICAIITDNHSVNVLAFKMLRNKYGEVDNVLSFMFNGRKIYNLFDSVHLIKNIRNNLLSAKRFIFPGFDFNPFEDTIHVEAGEISWRLFHEVYEKDELLPGDDCKIVNQTPKF